MPEEITIHTLTLPELKALYQERICTDFPRSERRPLHAIARLHRRGRYRGLVLTDGDAFLAYATFICEPGGGSILLDYFAVDEAHRGTGIGSRFLAQLLDAWPEKAGMLIECEHPDTAEDAAERSVRERRIAFYQRAGAEETPLRFYAYGVTYAILWLPIRVSYAASTAARDLQAIYALPLPAALRSRIVRLEEV